MEILAYPNGICPKHGPKLNVEGSPKCIPCDAEAERAAKGPRPVNSLPDPGDSFFSGKKAEDFEVKGGFKMAAPAGTLNEHLKAAAERLKLAQGQVDDLKMLKKLIKLRDQIKILIEE